MQGSNIFGGLLDRCISYPFAETYEDDKSIIRDQYYGSLILQNLSNIELDSVSSLPVQVCFCTNSGTEPDCSYQLPTIKVEKGSEFNVPLVAVDQVYHSVATDIIVSLSGGPGVDEGQQIQAVKNECTNLTYNVFSKQKNEVIKLYADGPCGSSSSLSVCELKIEFLNCTCQVGFMPSNKSPTRCECVCHMKLLIYSLIATQLVCFSEIILAHGSLTVTIIMTISLITSALLTTVIPMPALI